jgi:hypothetical protein
MTCWRLPRSTTRPRTSRPRSTPRSTSRSSTAPPSPGHHLGNHHPDHTRHHRRPDQRSPHRPRHRVWTPDKCPCTTRTAHADARTPAGLSQSGARDTCCPRISRSVHAHSAAFDDRDERLEFRISSIPQQFGFRRLSNSLRMRSAIDYDTALLEGEPAHDLACGRRTPGAGHGD